MWRAFERIEPFLDRRLEVSLAIVAATVANRSRGKDESAHSIEEFIPKFQETLAETESRLGGQVEAIFGRPPEE